MNEHDLSGTQIADFEQQIVSQSVVQSQRDRIVKRNVVRKFVNVLCLGRRTNGLRLALGKCD
jgi:hypothetical protein